MAICLTLEIKHIFVQSLSLLCVFAALLVHTGLSEVHPDNASRKRQAAPAASPLINFQVSEPVLTPSGAFNEYGCIYEQLLMDHVFAFSYGKPFVGSYIPPPCSFNRITMNFTVTSKGRQFDRLGLMYLGDIEVFRTSTAEPTTNGIVWTYIKEMDQFNSLWRAEQKIIFDLGNLVDNTYTGLFNTTLTATFFTVPESRPIADIILPISSRESLDNKPSAFSVPSQNASVAYTLPQNIRRAVVSLSACGQATEEFWYTNTLSSQVDTFASTTGTLYGYSPFREVQLLIDGQLAGVSWPFPVIFTGGIVPGLWRPIAGIDAFDLREHEIDVTPWLPILCDGLSHSFEIRVAGLSDDGNDKASLTETVGSNWVVSGKIFVFSDATGSITTGNDPAISVPAPDIKLSSSITTDATGANDSLTYETTVSRRLSISSTIHTSHGSQLAKWEQDLDYTNLNALTAKGTTQDTIQNTYGTDLSPSVGYRNTYSYPISVNSTFSIFASGAFGIDATLSHGLVYDIQGPSVFPSGIQSFDISTQATLPIPGRSQPQSIILPSSIPNLSGASITTTQSGNAAYLSAGKASYSYGTTEQDFDFKGTRSGNATALYELYRRHVKAVNSSVVEDQQTLVGRTLDLPMRQARLSSELPGFGDYSIRSMLGRGPGQLKADLVNGRK